MNLAGEYRINADRAKVWRMIHDPEILRRCIPGCEAIDARSPTDWTATVLAEVGPVKARFSGTIKLEDLEPETKLRIIGEGTGGAVGFAKGTSLVTLSESAPDATVLSYTSEAQIGGKLAQIGSRLIQSTAKKYADDFFSRFAAIIGGGETKPASETAGGPNAMRWLALAAGVALIAGAAYYFFIMEK